MTTEPRASLVEVTDADVTAAIDLKYALDDAGSTSWSIRATDPKKHPVAVAFARHRLEALRTQGDGALRRRVAEAIVNAFEASTPDLAHTLSLDWRDWTAEADAAIAAMPASPTQASSREDE